MAAPVQINPEIKSNATYFCLVLCITIHKIIPNLSPDPKITNFTKFYNLFNICKKYSYVRLLPNVNVLYYLYKHLK